MRHEMLADDEGRAMRQQCDGHQQEVDIGNVWADDERRSADALERLAVITRFEFETQK